MAHPLKGTKQSPEHVAKRVAATRARLEQDPSIREKMRVAAKGNQKGKANKGKVHTQEQNDAHNEFLRGRRASAETRAKMSAAHKKFWAESTPEWRAAYFEKKQKVSFKPTNIERQTHKWLDSEGIAFVPHPWVRVIYDGERRVFRPDVLLPAHNLIIEVQGCYWHGCLGCYDNPRTDRIEEDWLRKMLMEEQGYSVLELWEHDIKSGDMPEIIKRGIVDQA